MSVTENGRKIKIESRDSQAVFAPSKGDEKYHLLFNSTNDAMFFHDLEGRILEVNEAACKKLGYSCAELLRMKTSDIDDPNFHPDLGAIDEGLRATGHAVFEQVHVAKDGRRIPVELNVSPIVINDKTMILSVARDITERKRSEAALATAKESLEALVEERTKELSSQVALTRRAEDELRDLSARILMMQEEERRGIARDLHDQVGQTLTVIKLMLNALNKSAPEELKQRISDVSAQVSEVMKAVRTISQTIRPVILDDLGLVPGLQLLFESLKNQAGLKIEFYHELAEEPSTRIRSESYRIIQEALTNVMRHSGSNEASVRVLRDSECLELVVEDHGRGFDLNERRKSTGLSAMRERASLLSGKVEVTSEPGKGTTVLARIPWKPSETRV